VVEAVRAGPLAAGETPRPTTALPSTVQAVIAARLAQLTPLAQRVAQVAASVGRAFTFEILAAVGETPEANLVQSLDELWQRRIVREQEQGYDFCHDKIREVIYSQISRTRRQWLHRRIAEALEARHASNLEEVYPMLAAHFEMGNEGQRAVGYWQQAGEHALATYAPQQALDNFQRALALTNARSATVSQQADATFGLARAYFALDQHDEATGHGKQALALRQLDEPQRCKLLYFMADVAFASYDVASCESYAQAAREAAEISNDQETLCQSLSLLGQVCSTRGDLESELHLIQQALQRSQQTGNRWREGRTLADLGWLHAQRAEFEQAITVAGAALTMLVVTDDRAAVAFAWNVLGRAHGGCGHYASAFSAFARSEEVAASIDHKFLVAQAPNMRGWLYYQLGDYVRALELDQQGVQLAQAWNKRPAEISARINVALDLLHLGDPEEALAQLQSIQARIEEDAFGFHAWRWRLRLLEGQGLCQLALGQAQQAHELALVGERIATATTSRKYIAANQTLLGLALAQMQQVEAAICSLEQAVVLADTIGYQPLRWRGYTQLAILHQAVGNESAAQHCQSMALQVVQTIAAELSDDSMRAQWLGRSDVQALLQRHDRKGTP
jgi:tetratricopeptide (TPR) repeat protein